MCCSGSEGFPLKVAALAVGVIFLVLSMLSLAGSMAGMLVLEESAAMEVHSEPRRNTTACESQKDSQHVLMVVASVSAVNMLVNILMLYGSQGDYHMMLLPWIIIYAMQMLVGGYALFAGLTASHIPDRVWRQLVTRVVCYGLYFSLVVSLYVVGQRFSEITNTTA